MWADVRASLKAMVSMSFRAIVPAGGAGSRLWPKSRRAYPKFLHDFTSSGASLLQDTVDRLAAVADEVLVVTGDVHAGVVQNQVPTSGVITEPSPKDSMPAIALATAILARRYPREELVVGSFAADHIIRDDDAFGQAVAAAVRTARAGEIVTIGLTPTHAATAYGYIRPGEMLDDEGAARRVEEFVEKPDSPTAMQYVAQGYLWNAGMFVARADILLAGLASQHPDLAQGIAQIADAWDSPRRREVLAAVWPTLPAISIDHAIAEPLAALGKVAVVPADLGWSDIGDWDAIGDIRGDGAGQGLTVLGEADLAVAIDSPGAVIAPKKQVVVVGIEGAVVIETDEAILVTTRDRAQDVKAAVAALERLGRQDLL